MTNFNIGLFLLSVPAIFAQPETKLRGNTPPESVLQRGLQVPGWDERLGQCFGATCGLWGDPHMITCDGVGYDCQGVGTFNIMENQMYKIQGRFVPVGATEQALVEGWGLTEGASLTNDISIEFKSIPDAPLFQFGFGDLSRHDGTFLSEDGCQVMKRFEPLDMPGQRRSHEPTVRDCHNRCENTEGCTKFSWWSDGGCHLAGEGQVMMDAPSTWGRVVAGNVDECGDHHEPEELADPEERYKHGMIGQRCPLLFHQDGEMIDISALGPGEFFYGDYNAPIIVQNIAGVAILIQYTLENGEKAEIHLWARGNGPGELWSCHWDFWICLPFSQQAEFMANSTGLLGTPNGVGWDDFINREGEYIGLEFDTNWHKTLIDYCYDNHCTTQDELIITPPNGQTFEDIKCQHVEYKEFDLNDPSCVMTAEAIEASCAEVPYLLSNACMMDCCNGGCLDIAEVSDEIVGVKTLSEDEEAVLYEVPLQQPDSSCEGGELLDTSDTVCPSSETEIVKLLSTTGTQELPGDVFFGIKLDTGGDIVGRTVKFKVNNPFEQGANVYVKYGKSVFGHAFMDPKCDGFELPTGCNEDAIELEVACHDYVDVDPFALVQVYFTSPSVEGTTDIDECCKADVPADSGVVMYSFEIQCSCPTNAVAAR